MSSRKLLLNTLGAAVSVVSLGLLAPTTTFAQSTVDEVTVTGHYGPDGGPTRLSQAVSFADLDLSTHTGRSVLGHRISLTARYLCERLGEDETSTTLTPSCREAAVRDAMDQARPIITAYRRGELGPAWAAPYPAAWDSIYPDAPYADE